MADARFRPRKSPFIAQAQDQFSKMQAGASGGIKEDKDMAKIPTNIIWYPGQLKGNKYNKEKSAPYTEGRQRFT